MMTMSTFKQVYRYPLFKVKQNQVCEPSLCTIGIRRKNRKSNNKLATICTAGYIELIIYIKN